MSQSINLPTCGRIVHYYPSENDPICRANGAEFVPAFVIQAFGILHANLQVFTMSSDAPQVLRYSVNHKSEAPPRSPYWEWPPVPAPTTAAVVPITTSTSTDGISGDTTYKEWTSANGNRA